MAHHRYLAETIRYPEFIGEVPLADVTYSRELNGVGELSATMAIPEDLATASAMIDATRRYRVIHPERDGSLVAPYVIWAQRYVPGRRAVRIIAAELWSVIRRVSITDTLTFTNDDQADIVGDVLAHVQGQLGGDFGITYTPAVTGRRRDREYLGYERKPAGEAIEQLAAVIDGFDWRIDSYWSGDDIVREFRVDYPRTGRRAAVSQITFDLQAPGIEMVEWAEDATDASTRHTAIGAGDGDSQLIATEIDMDSIEAGAPLLDTTESLKDVSVPATLRGHARQGLRDRQPISGIPALSMVADREPTFGTYAAGDDVRVILAPGVDPYFPDGIDAIQRIRSWRLTVPDDGGPELVELEFGEVP